MIVDNYPACAHLTTWEAVHSFYDLDLSQDTLHPAPILHSGGGMSTRRAEPIDLPICLSPLVLAAIIYSIIYLC
jgi:hypothetical protein